MFFIFTFILNCLLLFFKCEQELDEAARRRFVKRFYVPLPDPEARRALLRIMLSKNAHSLPFFGVHMTRISMCFRGLSRTGFFEEPAVL